ARRRTLDGEGAIRARRHVAAGRFIRVIGGQGARGQGGPVDEGRAGADVRAYLHREGGSAARGTGEVRGGGGVAHRAARLIVGEHPAGGRRTLRDGGEIVDRRVEHVGHDALEHRVVGIAVAEGETHGDRVAALRRLGAQRLRQRRVG